MTLPISKAQAKSDVLGQAYEYLIKKFADSTNKKAGEFYTPRTVMRLMIDMLDPQAGETIYDPACGTGGMLLEAVRDDLDTLIMDAGVLQELTLTKDPQKVKEIEIKIVARLRRHKDNPKFVLLSEQLEQLKERHQQGLITSLEFLKSLLELARNVVEAEKEVDPVEEQDKAKAALTDLFNDARTANTPAMVERIVADIDAIVRIVRFPGWQQTSGGEREVQKALRKTLLKYKLHHEQELFDRAYGYIKQYY